MAFVYTWTGSNGTDWNDFMNWSGGPDFPTPGNDFFTDTTATFVNGAPVSGFGSANFFVVYASTTFTGPFTATGQSAGPLSGLFLTSFTVNSGTATFSAATIPTSLLTHADVLVGYDDPLPGAGTAELDFVAGAHAVLDTDNVIDASGNRVGENSLYVGDQRDGIVNILGTGTTVTTDSGIAIAAQTGVNGTMHVGSAASLHIGFSTGFGYYIGYGGTGSLLIDGGATVAGDGFADIGATDGSIGSVVVDGAGSDWHQAQTIAVGFFPGTHGSLTITNGATVETDASIKIGAGGTVTVGSGSSLISTGTSGIGARILVDQDGHLVMQGGTLTATATIADTTLEGIQVAVGGMITGTGHLTVLYVQNDGVIDANAGSAGGTLLVDGVNGISDPGSPGILSISGDATLELEGSVASNETVVFNNTSDPGHHETLRIDGPLSSFSAPIQGLVAGDAIDLAGVSGATTWSLDSATDLLTVKDASGTQLGALQLIGNYASTSFGLAADGNGGFTLTESSAAKAPSITSGGGERNAEYVINPGQQVITTIQASGTDVHYFIQDPRTGKLVTSTSQFIIDTNTGQLSFGAKSHDDAYHVTVVAKNGAGQTSQDLTVSVADEHIMVGRSDVPDTFVFHAGFTNDAVFDFNVASTLFCGRAQVHDVLQFDHTMFNGAVAGESGSALTDLLQNHTQSYGWLGTMINTDGGGHVFLAEVSKQALLSNATSDFHLV